MKKRNTMVAVALVCAALQLLSVSTLARAAELEWTTTRHLDLEQAPLDVAPSSDGSIIFILTPGEVLVYSVSKDAITNRIPVAESFDGLTYSAKDNSLILSSSRDMAIEIVRLETIHDIDVSGLPFKGPEAAPVTIAVFNDYQ